MRVVNVTDLVDARDPAEVPARARRGPLPADLSARLPGRSSTSTATPRRSSSCCWERPGQRPLRHQRLSGRKARRRRPSTCTSETRPAATTSSSRPPRRSRRGAPSRRRARRGDRAPIYERKIAEHRDLRRRARRRPARDRRLGLAAAPLAAEVPILALNAGSSSLKYAPVRGRVREPSAAGTIDLERESNGYEDAGARASRRPAKSRLRRRRHRSGRPPDRPRREPLSRVTSASTRRSRAGSRELASELAPLHNPPALAVLAVRPARAPRRAARRRLRHRFLRRPAGARRASIPFPGSGIAAWGVRRYGFHGLSHAGRRAAGRRADGRPAGPAPRSSLPPRTGLLRRGRSAAASRR